MRAHRALGSRRYLLGLIGEHADADGLNGHDPLYGGEAISLLGLAADGVNVKSGYTRLWWLERNGLLASVRTGGGRYRRWSAASCLALIEIARRESR